MQYETIVNYEVDYVMQKQKKSCAVMTILVQYEKDS